MAKLPISFTEKSKATPSGGGYPVQISAADLDKNFNYATTDFPKYDEDGNEQPWIVTEIVGPSGHIQRQLVFNPAAPSSGTHVLGVKDGVLTWIATEEC